jgi:hypothetical protein
MVYPGKVVFGARTTGKVFLSPARNSNSPGFLRISSLSKDIEE